MSEPSTLIAEPPNTASCHAAPVRTAWFRAGAATLVDPLVRRGVLSLFDQALVSGTSLATTLILARICSKHELGVYYLALSIVLFIRGIQEKLVSAPYMIYSNRYQGGALAEYSGSTLAHQVVISVVALAILLPLAVASLFGYGVFGLETVALALLFALPFALLRDYCRYFAFARTWLAAAIGLDAVVAAVQIGAMLILAWLGLLSATAVYWAIGVACAAACLGWFLHNRPGLVVRAARIKSDWLRNWAFARWALVTQLVGYATPYLMPWLLALVHGTAATGLLAACNSLIGPAHMLVAGLNNSFCPQAAGAFAHGGLTELKSVLAKTAALFAIAIGAICLLLAAIGDPLAVFVLGPKFAGVGAILTVMAVNVLLYALGIVAGNGLWALDRPAANLYADVTTLLATLAAAALLIGPFGVLGAALAVLAGTVVGAVVRWLTLGHIIRHMQSET